MAVQKHKIKIGILGADGFLGSELFNCLREYLYDVHGITRSNYNVRRGERFDIFINANGNSKRYWANNNVLEDFEASTNSVYKTFFDFKNDYYIYISSADVYVRHEDLVKTKEETAINPVILCPYGFHKYLSELIVKKHSNKYLILRCSAMIGKKLIKGPIRDMLDDKPLFITLDSKLQFISTSEIAIITMKLINDNIHNDIFNVGGVGAVSLNYLERILDKRLVVREQAEKQIYKMNVAKLRKIFPIKKSEEYVREYLNKLNLEDINKK